MYFLSSSGNLRIFLLKLYTIALKAINRLIMSEWEWFSIMRQNIASDLEKLHYEKRIFLNIQKEIIFTFIDTFSSESSIGMQFLTDQTRFT